MIHFKATYIRPAEIKNDIGEFPPADRGNEMGNTTNFAAFGLRIPKFGLAILAAAALLAAIPAASFADTGTIRATITKAGFIIGVGGGSGTLRFHGRNYPLRIGGMSVGATIGASSTDLIGRAYNLRAASDIVGTYTAIGGGAAIAGGGGSVRLQNAKGVVLELRGRKVGVEFSVAMGGVEISM